MKDIVILGGPNGAGKTTAAKVLLPERLGIVEFVNADEIARGLSPFDADRAALAAGRIMLTRMKSFIQKGKSFAFETTCSGRMYIHLLRKAKEEGWRINLLYLWLSSPEIALNRVAKRVKEGGHSIPSDTIIRRYWAGNRNLHGLYLPLADWAAIYDNSDQLKLIAERAPDLIVHDAAIWSKIESAQS